MLISFKTDLYLITGKFRQIIVAPEDFRRSVFFDEVVFGNMYLFFDYGILLPMKDVKHDLLDQHSIPFTLKTNHSPTQNRLAPHLKAFSSLLCGWFAFIASECLIELYQITAAAFSNAF